MHIVHVQLFMFWEFLVIILFFLEAVSWLATFLFSSFDQQMHKTLSSSLIKEKIQPIHMEMFQSTSNMNKGDVGSALSSIQNFEMEIGKENKENSLQAKVSDLVDETEPSGYRVLEFVSRGSFGRVYKVECMKTKKVYAAKCMTIHSIEQKEYFWLIQNEMNILKQMDSDLIIKLYDYLETPLESSLLHTCVILEYGQGGELFSYIYHAFVTWKMSSLGEAQSQYIFYQIVCALEYMQRKELIHRDLKPENILITSFTNDEKRWPNIKLIDFGFSCSANYFIDTNTINVDEANSISKFFFNRLIGSPGYLAYELWFPTREGENDRKYPYAADIWALGVILYVLMELKLPVEITKKDQKDLPFLKEKLNQISLMGKNKNLHWSPELRDLYTQMVQKDPKKRITYKQILHHPWIKIATF